MLPWMILTALAAPTDQQVAEACPVDGEAHACVRALAELGVRADQPPTISERVVDAWKRACDADESDGCIAAGWALDKGHSVTRDHAAALPYFERACDGGNGSGCKNAGYAYHHGQGAPRHMATAIGWYDKGCTLEDIGSCGIIAELHIAKAVPEPDDGVALSYMVKACDLGSGLGCYNVAGLMMDGRGAASNPDEELRYLVRACRSEQPHAEGCKHAGLLLESGVGTTPARPDVARESLARGCELADPASCAALGRFLYNGVGGSKDPEMAITLWRRVCDFGEATGCTYLEKVGIDPSAQSGAATDNPRAAGEQADEQRE